MEGRVIKILSEFCYVKVLDKIYPCKTKGVFRHKNEKVITGDFVEFTPAVGQELHGIINEILLRENELYRPQIANIDQVVVISAVEDPKFDSYILNKYLVFIETLKIEPILAFTKIDLVNATNPIHDVIEEYKKLGYKTFKINNIQPSSGDWNAFLDVLENKVTVFTGQTGAGKSTTLNHILPTVFQKTQSISKALGRGKQTTTSNEMFEYNAGFIADTPGFSSFELKHISALEVAKNYLRFSTYDCKFSDCLHNVPNAQVCAVFAAYECGEIPTFMYDDYKKIISEITDERRTKEWKK